MLDLIGRGWTFLVETAPAPQNMHFIDGADTKFDFWLLLPTYSREINSYTENLIDSSRAREASTATTPISYANLSNGDGLWPSSIFTPIRFGAGIISLPVPRATPREGCLACDRCEPDCPTPLAWPARTIRKHPARASGNSRAYTQVGT